MAASPEPDTPELPVYLDCAATTPMDPRVLETVWHYMALDYGNAGSHTHIYGTRANKAVEYAREAISAVVDAKPDEVFFTSGATESNNLALLGLADAARDSGKCHIVSTAIEHKAVLGPLHRLETKGFNVTYVKPTEEGVVTAEDILEAVRPDTFLVSIMHANNETGVIQPLSEIAAKLDGHDAYFHTDATQGFGKERTQITSRIDLISASAHKLYGPKGIGVLIARRRKFKRPPLNPLLTGGDQERGLRSGTVPVHLCAGFGAAASIMLTEHSQWSARCNEIASALHETLAPFDPTINGADDTKLPCILNVSLQNIDSDAIMLCLKDVVAISNGSACTSTSHSASHVLSAMGLKPPRIDAATRWSWSHMTPPLPYDEIRRALATAI